MGSLKGERRNLRSNNNLERPFLPVSRFVELVVKEQRQNHGRGADRENKEALWIWQDRAKCSNQTEQPRTAQGASLLVDMPLRKQTSLVAHPKRPRISRCDTPRISLWLKLTIRTVPTTDFQYENIAVQVVLDVSRPWRCSTTVPSKALYLCRGGPRSCRDGRARRAIGT